MKKLNLIVIIISVQVSTVVGQSCDLPVTDGQQYKLTSFTYDIPIMSNMTKFTKMKQKKKDEAIAKHNVAIEAGEYQPKSTFDVVYEVKELKKSDDYVYAKMVTNINNVEYTSHMICENDTLYMMRKEGRTDIYDPQGKFIGYQILGTQVLPRNIKVGDQLPPFSDMVFTTSNNVQSQPKTSSVTVGSWRYTTTSYHDVLKISNSTTETINYAYSEVTGTTEFELNGKKYTAYIIESESWLKTTTKDKFKSLDGEINSKKLVKKTEKFGAKIQKKVDRATMANKNGYIVIPKTEWYVPEIGIVNLRAEIYGFVTSETKLVGIE